MVEIKVSEGNRCWLVFLTDPDPHKWHVLKSFPTEKEAVLWAANLLNDLAAQRQAMSVKV